VGFFAHAAKFGNAAADGKVLAPAKTLGDMSRVVFNDYVCATLAIVFVAVVLSTLAYAVITIRNARRTPTSTAREVGAAVLAGGTR
jgi:carbon starvation protein